MFEAFFQSYLETLLWSECDFDTQAPFDGTHDVTDIRPADVESMRAECQAFYDANNALWPDNDDGTAGHDFCLTRNRHGAGFWDGGYENGTELTEAAHVYGTCGLTHCDDGTLAVHG